MERFGSGITKIQNRTSYDRTYPAVCCLTELRPVTNTNIVIGNREPSSGSITIILGGAAWTSLMEALMYYSCVVYHAGTHVSLMCLACVSLLSCRQYFAADLSLFMWELMSHQCVGVLHTVYGAGLNKETTFDTVLEDVGLEELVLVEQ